MKLETRTQQDIIEGSARLSDVIVSGDVSHLKYLLDYEADVKLVGKDGRTALHFAADLGNAEMCSLLIRHGADVNVQTHTGITPLFFASRWNLHAVQVLIQSGCDVTLCSYNDDTPLHAASASGRDDIIAELISAGCDVNAENCDGSTPLFLAIESGSRNAVKALIKCGADPNAVFTAPSKEHVLKNLDALELSRSGLLSRNNVCQRVPRPTVAESRGQGKPSGLYDQGTHRQEGRQGAACDRHASGQPQCQLTRRAKLPVRDHHGHSNSHRVEPQRQPQPHQPQSQHRQQVLSTVGCDQQTEPVRRQADSFMFEPQVDLRYDVWQKRSRNSQDLEFLQNSLNYEQISPHVKRLQGNTYDHRRQSQSEAHPPRDDFLEHARAFDALHQVDFGFPLKQVPSRDCWRQVGHDKQMQLPSYRSQDEHTNTDSSDDQDPFMNLLVRSTKSDVNPFVHAATSTVNSPGHGHSMHERDDQAVPGFARRRDGKQREKWYRRNQERRHSDLFINAVGIELKQRREACINSHAQANAGAGNNAGGCMHTGVNEAPHEGQQRGDSNPLAVGSGFVAMIPSGIIATKTATDCQRAQPLHEPQGDTPRKSVCDSDDKSHRSNPRAGFNREITSGQAPEVERPAPKYLFASGKHVAPGDGDAARETFSTRSKPEYVSSWLRKWCEREGFDKLPRQENSVVRRSSLDSFDVHKPECAGESSGKYPTQGTGSRATISSETALSQAAIGNDSSVRVSPEKSVSYYRKNKPLSSRSYFDKKLRPRIQGAKEEQPEYSVLPDEIDSLLDVNRCYSKVSTGKGITPLHRAAQLGMESVASVLLDAGSNVNAVTETGETPMHFAALYSSISGRGEATCLLRLLLKAGADLKAVTRTGETPLHFAALVGDALTTAILISAGADVKAVDLRGNVPLHKVCGRVVVPESNRVRTTRLLLSAKSDPNARNKDGLAPIHVLLENRESSVDLELLQELVAGGADPNMMNLESLSYPLMSALHLSQMEYGRVLVQKGAHPNVSDQDGRTPMHLACTHGDVKLFQLLLAKGGDPRKLDRHGFSPLRCAVASGRESMVRACIASGVSTWQVRHSPGSQDVQDKLRRWCLLGGGGIPSSFNPVESPFCSAFCAGDSVSMELLLASGSVCLRELHQVGAFCDFISAEDFSHKHKEAIAVVRQACQSPPSLQHFCRWKISHLIGCAVNRKSRAQALGLPAMLRDLVLFVDLC